jgi:hypothetical protein
MYFQAPEVDGVVYITGYSERTGRIANVKMEGFNDYDLIGTCVGNSQV